MITRSKSGAGSPLFSSDEAVTKKRKRIGVGRGAAPLPPTNDDTSTVISELKKTIFLLEEKLADQTKVANYFRGKIPRYIERVDKLLVSAEEFCAESAEFEMAASETKKENEELSGLVRDVEGRLAESEIKVRDGEKLRKKLHNIIMELKGNIRVFCRVRPFLPKESAGSESNVIMYPASMEARGQGIALAQNGKNSVFTFDKVFNPEASQQDVFVEISQLVQSALDGYKVCIFAYGQTGSGKTYTMMGRPEAPDQKGLIPRSLEQIFETSRSLESQGWKYKMQVSMLEIYKETIRDLLAPNQACHPDASRFGSSVAAGMQYTITHDVNGNTHVSNLTVNDVCSIKEIYSLLHQAAKGRSVGQTQMNEQSSRSHFVFTLHISSANEATGEEVQGVLNMIDLAGSARLSKTGAIGEQLQETQAINKSLSSLIDVISSLAKKEGHVPFRNSKLTHLLQTSLGGNSKTLMFVNISPEPSSVDESLCSLRFAARVNDCEIGIPARPMTRPESTPKSTFKSAVGGKC